MATPWIPPQPSLSWGIKNVESPTASTGRLQYMDVYMDNLLCAAQGHPYHKHRVPKLTIRALNDILLYIPDEVKYLASLKKVLDGDSN